jgi:hypothetical protein
MAQDTIFVIARPDLGNRTALWEIDDRHPGGEVYVDGANPRPVEVFRTNAVTERLAPNGGTLIELTGKALETAQKAAQTEADRVEAARAEALAQGAKERDEAQSKLAAVEKRAADLEAQLAKLQGAR